MKLKQPTSEETRRKPVKAYTLRVNVRYRPGHTSSLSPLKMRENKDLTIANTASQNNITRLKGNKHIYLNNLNRRLYRKRNHHASYHQGARKRL